VVNGGRWQVGPHRLFRHDLFEPLVEGGTQPPGGWGPQRVQVRERGERSGRRQGGGDDIQEALLTAGAEQGPRQAADHHLGGRQATVAQYLRRGDGVGGHDLHRRMTARQIAGEAAVDLDGDMPAAAGQSPLYVFGERAGAGAQFQHDRITGERDRRHHSPAERGAARGDGADGSRVAGELGQEGQGVVGHRTDARNRRRRGDRAAGRSRRPPGGAGAAGGRSSAGDQGGYRGTRAYGSSSPGPMGLRRGGRGGRVRGG
jgi:hypothetical protein